MPGIWEQIGTAVAKNVDIDGLSEKVWAKIWTWAEPKLDETVDKYTPIVIEKLMAMFPTLAATAVKFAIEKAFEGHPGLPNIQLPDVATLAGEVIDGVLNSDPDIPGLSNVIDITEIFRKLKEGHL